MLPRTWLQSIIQFVSGYYFINETICIIHAIELAAEKTMNDGTKITKILKNSL